MATEHTPLQSQVRQASIAWYSRTKIVLKTFAVCMFHPALDVWNDFTRVDYKPVQTNSLLHAASSVFSSHDDPAPHIEQKAVQQVYE